MSEHLITDPALENYSRWMELKDAAAYTGLSIKTLRRKIKDKTLKWKRTGDSSNSKIKVLIPPKQKTLYPVSVPVPDEPMYCLLQPVKKRRGYIFEGHIVSVFHKLNGVVRYVVQNREGLLHIFSESDLEERTVSDDCCHNFDLDNEMLKSIEDDSNRALVDKRNITMAPEVAINLVTTVRAFESQIIELKTELDNLKGSLNQQ